MSTIQNDVKGLAKAVVIALIAGYLAEQIRRYFAQPSGVTDA